MLVTISTIMNTNENRLWQKLKKVTSHQYIIFPLLKFKPQRNYTFPETWELGVTYKLKMSLFGFIPLGNHLIEVIEINENEKRIVSNEHGSLTKIWNHTVTIRTIDEQKVEYTDKIVIKAGILTFAIWLFAHFFYRHRQRRWKKLLAG